MVLSFEEALAVVLEHAAAVAPVSGVETLPLRKGRGRVLAEEVRTPRDQPPFARSTRDGFALRAADLDKPLRVLGTVKAGEQWQGKALGAGEAVEIMTGAPLPQGTDAVLMVEHAVVNDNVLQAATSRSLRAGENVVPRAAEARAGDVVLPAGTLLEAPTIALAASCGAASVTVRERVKVAVLSTGDELVELDATPEDWQIYNSNTPALAALVEREGAGAGRVKIARDIRDGEDGLRERIAQISMSDLAVLTGGVSMGKFDLVKEVLEEFGAEFFFTGAKIQPGKPVVFGRMPKSGIVGGHGREPWTGDWTYFFGLPGNPVSADVCFRLFVTPILRALSGRTDLAPQFAQATAAQAFESKPGLIRFLPATMSGSYRGVTITPVTWQGSGDVAANGRANAYCVVPESGVQAGETATVLLR